jgi:hypothetical protein
MELQLKRKEFTDNSTIGELAVNGVSECFILEDKDRKLETGAKKIHGLTAIPRGRYEIVITFSNRFQQYLPLLLSVPQYEGVRIHSGNTSANTEGCLLPGTTKSKDFVGGSRDAFQRLFSKLKKVEKKEKIFITIT